VAFNDIDATAEIAKLSNQVTTLLVQMAELRTEFSALRREFDKIYNDRVDRNGVKQVSVDRLPGWALIIMALTIMILLLVYVGGRAGAF
jgi:hypothetical protein